MPMSGSLLSRWNHQGVSDTHVLLEGEEPFIQIHLNSIIAIIARVVMTQISPDPTTRVSGKMKTIGSDGDPVQPLVKR